MLQRQRSRPPRHMGPRAQSESDDNSKHRWNTLPGFRDRSVLRLSPSASTLSQVPWLVKMNRQVSRVNSVAAGWVSACFQSPIGSDGVSTSWLGQSASELQLSTRLRGYSQIASILFELSITSGSPGFIQNAAIEPRNNKTILPMNGSSQLFVLSTTYPKISGERIAANADPVFMKPLAEPEYRGAISIGIAHMGPTVNSVKKNAMLRQTVARVRSCRNSNGTINASEHT